MNNLLIYMTREEFREELKTVVAEVLKEQSEEQKNNDELTNNDFEPRDESMRRLHVRSYATMIKYERKGILKPYRIGRNIFYRKSEVNEALKGFNRI